ncbi:MAG: hypothetical protein EAX81_08455 [Candidatus Thorarchaeota archaeon]|nr:hypothetical protein [Candidatus Thorarchaeota archaeon]
MDTVLGLWETLLRDAIVYLKHNDYRERDYHDAFAFGVEKLAKVFTGIGSYEKSISVIIERNRDHIVHVVRTYLLGWKVFSRPSIGYEIIDCGDTKYGEVKIKFGNKEFDFKISVAEKEAMWCIIALCHDLGLALENVYDLNRAVRSTFEQIGKLSVKELEYVVSPMFQNICSQVLSVTAASIQPTGINGEFAIHIQPKYYHKFMVALDSYDHGVLSCVILMRSLVYFLETDFQLDKVKSLKPEDARQFLIRSNILRAIASHNCDFIYHITIMNFPFLLVLMDEMQEWDRPRPAMFRQENVLKARLEILTLNTEEVEFIVIFRGDDKDKHHEEVYEYAKRKFQKFLRILRCAVDSRGRIKLKFHVEDATRSTPWRYILDHQSPRKEDIVITMPKTKEWEDWAGDRTKEDWLDL